MVSDIVCEYMVKRKLDQMQLMKAVAIILGGSALTLLACAFGAYSDKIGMMAPMLLFVGTFLIVFFARHAFMIEYEYAYFNGEITIDRITARSKRKHMLDVELKSVEKMGRPDDEAINRLKISKVKDFSQTISNKDTIYLYFRDENNGENILLFLTPNQKMLDAMKTSVSATVYREYFSKVKKNTENN